MANPRDKAQACPHFFHSPEFAGALPVVCLRRQPAAGVPVGKRGLSKALFAHKVRRPKRRNRPPRRNVGRARLQYGFGRKLCAADFVRHGIFQKGIRNRARLFLDSRLFRLLSAAAANSVKKRREKFYHAKNFMEHGKQIPAPQLLVGGHRRFEGFGAHAARGNLQQPRGAAQHN